MKKGDQPIYPVFSSNGAITTNPDFLEGNFSLTKREYFAGLAMQGLCSRIEKESPETLLVIHENTAKWAVKFADALLSELEKS